MQDAPTHYRYQQPQNCIDDLLAELENCTEEIQAWQQWAKPGEGPAKPIVTTIVLKQARETMAKAKAT